MQARRADLVMNPMIWVDDIRNQVNWFAYLGRILDILLNPRYTLYAIVSESILNTYPVSVLPNVDFDCVNTFSENGRRPQFSIISCPLAGQNLDVDQKRISSEHWPNLNWIAWIILQIMVGNHHLQSYAAIKGPQLGQRGPKVNHFWTLTQ